MSDGAIRHAAPHPPTERTSKCGGCRLQAELDQLRSGATKPMSKDQGDFIIVLLLVALFGIGFIAGLLLYERFVP